MSYIKQTLFEPCDDEKCQVCCNHSDGHDHGMCLNCDYYEHQREPKFAPCGQEK